MKFYRFSLLALLVPSIAAAHISVASGPAIANKSSQKISFAISHGCNSNTLDTLSIQVDIPTDGSIDQTSVRPMPSDFDGRPIITKSGNNVGSIKWTRNPADLQDGDLAYYEITVRLKVNNVPFTKVPFTVTQVCRPQGGNASQDVTVVWTGSVQPEPAPTLTVVPAHSPGWNKITLAAAVSVSDFGAFFGDAQIVWKGTAAFSANATIATLITATTGVTALGDLAAGDEIWVKY
jgi:uncharacterized protein YcnI